MAIQRRYNWRPSKPDIRDHLYSVRHPLIAATALPKAWNNQQWCSPVFDQGNEGSCTGHGWAAADEYMQLREIRYKLAVSAEAPELFDATQYIPASRQFIYWCERFLEGDTDQDGGAEVRDGAKVLSTIGVCREALWPYTSKNMFTKPSAAAYAEASQHKILHYTKLNGLSDIRHCLASQYVAVFGFSVYDNFESDHCAATGDLKMPGPDESVQGGHCVVAVGYDDNLRHLICRNSWGASWGKGGYFTMPFSYITSGLASDFWTMTK